MSSSHSRCALPRDRRPTRAATTPITARAPTKRAAVPREMPSGSPATATSVAKIVSRAAASSSRSASNAPKASRRGAWARLADSIALMTSPARAGSALLPM